MIFYLLEMVRLLLTQLKILFERVELNILRGETRQKSSCVRIPMAVSLF